jgi:CHAT domain-containing protein
MVHDSASEAITLASCEEEITDEGASGRERGIALKKATGHEPASSFSHPFYWAPFILIGNWK